MVKGFNAVWRKFFRKDFAISIKEYIRKRKEKNMKRKALVLILALVLCLSVFSGSVFADGAEDKDILILYTSDVHCGIDRGWGYAGVYAAKQQLASDYNILLVDDGDAFQGEPIGTMTKGESIINIMNTLGYDVAIPGNHDFDYGMDRFLELV